MVVWQSGEALLALDLDTVEEVVKVEPSADRAVCRAGELELASLPGMPPSPRTRRAVIVRSSSGARRMALGAEQVEGVFRYDSSGSLAPPAWLESLELAHLSNLVRLEDGRLAAVLDPDILLGQR